MSKKLQILRGQDLQNRIDALNESARLACEALQRVCTQSNPINALASVKFNQLGLDPLDPHRPLNFIEQVNQTFTYLAAFRATKDLFSRHKDIDAFTLNLGNVGGWDIESSSTQQVVAEVFATVDPSNNQKLNNDLKRVVTAPHEFKYVYFICPSIPPGRHSHRLATGNVIVWSLGPP